MSKNNKSNQKHNKNNNEVVKSNNANDNIKHEFIIFKYKEYKELYYQTLEKRERLSSRVNLFLTISLAEITAFAYVTNLLFEIWNSLSCNYRIISIVFISLNILCFVCTFIIYILFLIHINHNHITPEHIQSCFNNNEQLKGRRNNDEINENIVINMSDVFIHHAIENDKVNSKKGSLQVKLLICVFMDLLFVACEFFIFNMIRM